LERSDCQLTRLRIEDGGVSRTALVQHFAKCESRHQYQNLIGRQLRLEVQRARGGFDSTGTRDGGVWAVDLADASSTPIEIVPGGTPLSNFGTGRGPFHVSETGRTVTSTVGSRSRSRIDVIETSTLSLRANLDNDVIYGLGDDVALVPRSGAAALVNLVTGHEAWTFATGPEATTSVLGVLVGAREAFVSYSKDGSLHV
jgi:hypothetical protein